MRLVGTLFLVNVGTRPWHAGCWTKVRRMKTNMKALKGALAALLLCSARPAYAETKAPVVTPDLPDSSDTAKSEKSDPPVPLGTRGTRALAIVADLGPANSGVASRPIGLGADMVLDNFVLSGLSIGGEFGFEYSDAYGSFYDVGGGPRVGYAIALGDKLALWPTLVFAYEVGTVPVAGSNDAASLQDLRLGAQLPLVMTLGGQTAIELGPIASLDLWRSVAGQSAPAMTLVGLRAGIVGWF